LVKKKYYEPAGRGAANHIEKGHRADDSWTQGLSKVFDALKKDP